MINACLIRIQNNLVPFLNAIPFPQGGWMTTRPALSTLMWEISEELG